MEIAPKCADLGGDLMNQEPELRPVQPAYYPAGWFEVSGDIDDFIFYGQQVKCCSER